MGKLQRSFDHQTWRKLVALGVLLAFFGLHQGVAVAQAPEQSAHEFAEDVKDELVSVIEKKDELEQKGEYTDAVEGVLEPVVDFEYIARGVMGRYAKEATDAQRERFAEEFKASLVNTYAKGLAGYGNYDITVVPPEEDVSGKRTVGVWLNVSNGDTTHRLAFTTRLNREGEWKVTNMILNGVNLGKAFRGQFENAMKRNDGEIDTVIDNWRV